MFRHIGDILGMELIQNNYSLSIITNTFSPKMNIDLIYNEQMVDDLSAWMEEESRRQLAAKALRVSIKCRRSGRKELAEKIDIKYRHLHTKDDLSSAFEMMLRFQQKQQ